MKLRNKLSRRLAAFLLCAVVTVGALTMAAGTYTHPDKGTPFDERSKEHRERVRQELKYGRPKGDR